MRSQRSLQTTPLSVVAAFLLPSFLGFAIFMAAPILVSVGISFTNFSGGGNFRFLGLTNYINAFKSAVFRHNLGVTITFTVWAVLLQLALGLALALLLNENMVGRNFFRGVMFLPNVLSTVAVGLMFSLLLDAKRGPVNQLLANLGFTPPLWLAGEKTALPTIIMVTVWQNFGYYMVLFLGGLQTVSQTLYEAAAIDGAGPVRRFLSVTLPGLSPIIFFSITMAVIRAFQVFDQVYVMTGGQAGGGPAGATSVVVFDIYKSGFTQFRFGYASAESVILLAIVLIITLIQQKGQKKWVTYDIV
ncbi:MAG: sugar ABC transporter permease [Treponema sp.]|jgi:multiple sugar transport system permease protein|nr:sugar ABC transporter permease [Treponema sp.]